MGAENGCKSGYRVFYSLVAFPLIIFENLLLNFRKNASKYLYESPAIIIVNVKLSGKMNQFVVIPIEILIAKANTIPMG